VFPGYVTACSSVGL
jgi:fatty-acyl-CoA synthase